MLRRILNFFGLYTRAQLNEIEERWKRNVQVVQESLETPLTQHITTPRLTSEELRKAIRLIK